MKAFFFPLQIDMMNCLADGKWFNIFWKLRSSRLSQQIPVISSAGVTKSLVESKRIYQQGYFWATIRVTVIAFVSLKRRTWRTLYDLYCLYFSPQLMLKLSQLWAPLCEAYLNPHPSNFMQFWVHLRVPWHRLGCLWCRFGSSKRSYTLDLVTYFCML